MEPKIKTISEKLEQLEKNLSNPKELIHFTCKLAANLSPVWDSGDYYQKQMFQNVLFPQGLLYDVKIEHYRTPVVNEAIACIAYLSKGLKQIKKPDSLYLLEKSGSVHATSDKSNRLLDVVFTVKQMLLP
jgi:mannitol/fructose-specific phosphotransferase system IIA component (Ntr-type)